MDELAIDKGGRCSLRYASNEHQSTHTATHTHFTQLKAFQWRITMESTTAHFRAAFFFFRATMTLIHRGF